jgi:hypothetical protein
MTATLPWVFFGNPAFETLAHDRRPDLPDNLCPNRNVRSPAEGEASALPLCRPALTFIPWAFFRGLTVMVDGRADGQMYVGLTVYPDADLIR